MFSGITPTGDDFAHEHIWQLTHNGNYHHEQIYSKYQYDKKTEKSTDKVVDWDFGEEDASDEEVDILFEASDDPSNEQAQGNSDNEIVNLCVNKKSKLFNPYELADLVIKHEFELNNFK